MTYATNELFSSTDVDPYPRIKPDHQSPKTIGPISGAPTITVGTPMAYDTGNDYWVPWTHTGTGDTDDIRGFIYPEDVPADASNDVLGIIMTAGEIHYDDIVLPDGENVPALKLALKGPASGNGPSPKDRGLFVQGLENVR